MFVCLAFVWFEYEIPVDYHPHRKTRPDRQRRLNIEIALNNLLSGLIQALAGTAAKRLDDISIVTRIRARVIG